jgi:predicted RND superfamily exporter protein
VTPAFAIVGLSAVALATQLRIDTYLVDDLKEDTYIIQDLRWIEASGFGLFQTNLFVRAAKEELTDPEMMAWFEDFQRFVEKEPLVAATFGLPDLVRSVSRRPVKTLSQSDIASAMVWARISAPGVVEGVYQPDEGAAQIVVAVKDEGSRVTLPFVDRVDDYLAGHPPPAGSAELTGTVRMAHMFSFHVLRSFGPSIVLALALIWGVMSLLFRSARFGLLAMIPNVFPLVVLLGVMVLAGVPLKPSTILVFSIAFGIAVDDSIHMMGRFTQRMSRGSSHGRAVRGALRETGPALVMSTVVVTAGFSLLLISRFELLFLVGLLTATTAVTALVADLFLFPALLGLMGNRLRHVHAGFDDA